MTNPPTQPQAPSRRELLAGAAAAAAGLAVLPACATTTRSQAASPASPPPRAGRALRIAHFTDCHTQPERRADQGTIAALAHVNNLADKPDVLITGGDLIFSAFAQTQARAQTQWDLFTTALRDHNRLPALHCLGNHDIWGWDKQRSQTTGTEAQWGKRWATDLLSMPGPYYSTTRAGVKLIVLDSVQPLGESGYQGGLDDAQFEWLEGELASTPAQTPIVVITHIPIIHASTLLVDARFDDQRRRLVGAGSMYVDALRVVGALTKHPNVRAVLSGHIHMVERIDYAGIAWINSGAVSGAWWQSQNASRRFFEQRRSDPTVWQRPNRAEPGYALIDVSTTGEVAFTYQTYPWQSDDT